MFGKWFKDFEDTLKVIRKLVEKESGFRIHSFHGNLIFRTRNNKLLRRVKELLSAVVVITFEYWDWGGYGE